MSANDSSKVVHGQHPLNDPSPLITLFELNSLGGFTRNQDLVRLLGSSVTEMPVGYPLFPTRIQSSKDIDLFINDRWERVEYVARDQDHIHYRNRSLENKTEFSKYCVAPAGLFTSYRGDTSTIGSATLSKNYKQPSGAFVTGSEIQNLNPPYVTFRIEYADGRGSSGWYFETFHIADPRVQVDGVMSIQPFYNSPIAISHRWLSDNHPDPDGVHFRELLALAKTMQLLDCQTFFIDYCGLPQSPRTLDENTLFRRQLLDANSFYRQSTVILVEQTDDYEMRAWCMFEMILSAIRNAILNKDAVAGKLKAAFDLSRSFVDASRANFKAKRAFGIMPGRSISPRQFSKWAHGSFGLNRMYFEMQHRNKESIVHWFRDHGLKATNMEDIPVIEGLVEELI